MRRGIPLLHCCQLGLFSAIFWAPDLCVLQRILSVIVAGGWAWSSSQACSSPESKPVRGPPGAVSGLDWLWIQADSAWRRRSLCCQRSTKRDTMRDSRRSSSRYVSLRKWYKSASLKSKFSTQQLLTFCSSFISPL